MKTIFTLFMVIATGQAAPRTKRNFTVAEIMCMRSSLTCQVGFVLKFVLNWPKFGRIFVQNLALKLGFGWAF